MKVPLVSVLFGFCSFKVIIHLRFTYILIIGDFPAEKVFNRRISIPKNIIFPGINWLTRLFALRLSPFEITLEIDSDTVNCVNLYGLLNDIYELRKGYVDIAVMQTSKAADLFHPQNGAV
jgi:hypothetical protein